MTFTRVTPSTGVDRTGRTVTSILSGFLCIWILSGTAHAHQVSGTEFEAPLPLSLLLAGSGATVALTAAWLAVAGSTSQKRIPTCRILTVSTSHWSNLRNSSAVLFMIIVSIVVITGLIGRQVPNENLATVFTWGVWIHGLGLVAIIVGSPWQALAPWRLAYRGLTMLEGRKIVLYREAISTSAWPALGVFLVLIGIVENLTVIPRSPRLTAVVVVAYAFAMLTGSIIYGSDWFSRADPLEVLYNLLERVSPITASRNGDTVVFSFRMPWQALVRPVSDLSLVAFVVAMVFTVSFDGFVETRTFQSVLFTSRELLNTGPGTSVLLYLVGYCGFITVFVIACWGCERLGAWDGDWRSATEHFIPTVIPIAAAYEIAHNYPFVFRSAGRGMTLVIRLVSPDRGLIDPLWWLSVPQFWASQVVFIVLGHVIAVVAAHHVAVDRYGQNASVGHLPMVTLMVGYTVLSLWIISQPVIT